MNTTGPYAMDRAVKRSGTSYKLLPADLINPCSLCDTKCEARKSAILGQLEGGSWNGGDSLFYNYVFCHWRRIAATVVAIVAIVAIGVVIFKFRR